VVVVVVSPTIVPDVVMWMLPGGGLLEMVSASSSVGYALAWSSLQVKVAT
jgi:hypothetical protein